MTTVMDKPAEMTTAEKRAMRAEALRLVREKRKTKIKKPYRGK